MVMMGSMSLNCLRFFRRISHVMLLVPNIHWIIVEDAEENTVLVKNFLNRTGLHKRTTLLHAKTPTDFKLKDKVSDTFCFSVTTFSTTHSSLF
jgi:Glycosyltransferase family 43